MAASNTSDLKLYNNMGFVEFEREYQPHWSWIWSSAPFHEIKHFNFTIKHPHEKTFPLKLGRVFANEISEQIYNRVPCSVPWRVHWSQRFLLIFLLLAKWWILPHAEKIKRIEKSSKTSGTRVHGETKIRHIEFGFGHIVISWDLLTFCWNPTTEKSLL